MQLELRLMNDRRTLPSVRAFVHETLRQFSLPDDQASAIEELALGAVSDAVDQAYPSGEEGAIQLTIREAAGKLELIVRDYGLPQDVSLLERQLHETSTTPRKLFGCPLSGVVDEMHWLAYGSAGKALQLLKWLHQNNIADHPDTAKLETFHDDVPLAPPQEYAIRRMLPAEAVQVSQLMYRAYGNTYFNQDVYYPERVAAQNAHNTLISIVAQGADGRLVGHCALELDQEGPVAELGQAVVDPAHRGRQLLNRMKDACKVEAERLGLVGWYADAVAVHTFTQKSNADHGGHLTGVELGISPKTEAFRNISEEQPQRVSCLLYFHWLKQPARRTLYVPNRHRDIIATIYQNLLCPTEFANSTAAVGHGMLVTKVDASAGRAVIHATALGADTVHAIAHAKRELVEHSRVEVVFVDLPLTDPGTPHVVEALENEGFGFAAVAPHFSPNGDSLRLCYLVEPLVKEPIKIYEPFGHQIVDYALAEQLRVRADL